MKTAVQSTKAVIPAIVCASGNSVGNLSTVDVGLMELRGMSSVIWVAGQLIRLKKWILPLFNRLKIAWTSRMPDVKKSQDVPSLAEAFCVWLKIGLLSFGGPAGQIALMHKLLVEDRRWIDEERFLHALNYCMLLPGPEAQQLATYIGWLLNRTIGGLIAGVLFVLPGAIVMLSLSIIYALYAKEPLAVAIFVGVMLIK